MGYRKILITESEINCINEINDLREKYKESGRTETFNKMNALYKNLGIKFKVLIERSREDD